MPIRSGETAPYAPGATVLGLLAAYRNRGLAKPFNADVLRRAGVSDSLVPRTLKALELLSLIDAEGNPTTELEGLQRAPEAEYKQRLEAVIRDVYAEVFQFVDPAHDDAAKIADAFRAFEPIGQRPRMVTLFLALCEAAGIIPEGKKPAVNAGRSSSAVTRKGGRSSPSKSTRDSKPAPPQTPQMDKGVVVGSNIPPAVAGLIASMPKEGESWSAPKKAKWMETLKVVIDFAYPETDAPNPIEDEDR